MNILLSHNDLDGYGCLLTALKMKTPLTYFNVGYDTITENLEYINTEILPTRGTETTFYITDLCFKESDTIALYKLVKHNPNITIVYIDHHHYESEKQNKIFEKMKEFNNFKFVHNMKYCATFLFYQYALKKGLISFDESYDKLMKIIDVYDTWKEEDPMFKVGLSLNDVFREMRPSPFIEHIVKSYKIDDGMKDMIKTLISRKNDYFKRLESENFIIPLGDTLLFLADNFISHITIDYPHYKYYINGRSNGGISVRFRDISEESAINLKSKLTEHLSMNPYILSLGGHTMAMGVTLHPEHKDKMINVVEVIAKFFATQGN